MTKRLSWCCALAGLAAVSFGCSDGSGLMTAAFDAGGLTESGGDGGQVAADLSRSRQPIDGLSPQPTDGPDGQPEVTAEAACEQAAQYYCAKFESCLPFVIKLLWGDVKTCAERLKISCVDDFKAPGSGLTPTAISACVNALPTASCEDLITYKVEACLPRGIRADGLACGSDAQCASSRCSKAAADSCGHCTAKSAAGGPCWKDKYNTDCQPGLVCSKAGQCAAPAGVGKRCDATLPCGYRLYCTRAGTCAPSATTPGAPCDDVVDDSCDGGSAGLMCNPLTRKCQSVAVAKPGEACGLLRSPPTVCAGGAIVQNCLPDLISGGLCVAPAADGQACGPAAGGRECLYPALCVAGVCALPSAAACP